MTFMLVSTYMVAGSCSLFAFNQELANELHKTSSHIEGPNCWNGALYVSQVVDSKKFTSPEEWEYILDNHCQEVDVPSYGDIGRIQDYLGVEVHGFIYIDHESIFAKHGKAIKDGYKFMSFENMLFYYGRTRECRTSNRHDKDCYNRIRYYRCRSKLQLNLHIRQISSLFDELVFSNETKYKHRDRCTSESFLQREYILNEILIELKRLKEIAHFLKKADQLLLKSFLVQLSDIEVSNRVFRCSDRNIKKVTLRKVKRELKSLIL